MSDPADLTARALLSAYAGGKLSPVEVMQAVIRRIEAWEPKLNALYAYDPEPLLAEAHASEERWRTGGTLALDGVPVTVKENIATRGTPVPLGTAATSLSAAENDAPAPARLREAGAIIIAKTTMPDYGMLSSGLSSFHPLTRNPWNLAKNPGGSSSGAGAAAAAGYGPLHLGTDIGGSVRLPAAWCGVVGFKPSFGRVPVDPPYYGRAAGPMTRTVEDCALMMREIARPDPRDSMSLPAQDIPWRDLALDLEGVRIGLHLDAGVGLEPEPEVRAAIEAAGQLFAEAGARVEPFRPFLTRAMLDGLDRFWRQRAWSDIGALPEATRAKILPFILAWAKGGASLSGAEVYAGMSQMMVMRLAANAAFAEVDYVISPVSPVLGFPAENASPLNDPERPFEHIGFTVPYNMSEQPAVAVPAAMSSQGVPIGLQIAGRRFDDIGVLRLAHAFERLREPLPPYPSLDRAADMTLH